MLCIVINYKSRGSIATHLSFDYSERYMTDDSSIVISSASRQTVASDKHQFPRGEVCNSLQRHPDESLVYVFIDRTLSRSWRRRSFRPRQK